MKEEDSVRRKEREPVRGQDPGDLPDRRARFFDVLENLRAEHEIERLVSVRQTLGRADLVHKRPRLRVEPPVLARVPGDEREIRLVAAANIKRPGILPAAEMTLECQFDLLRQRLQDEVMTVR